MLSQKYRVLKKLADINAAPSKPPTSTGTPGTPGQPAAQGPNSEKGEWKPAKTYSSPKEEALATAAKEHSQAAMAAKKTEMLRLKHVEQSQQAAQQANQALTTSVSASTAQGIGTPAQIASYQKLQLAKQQPVPGAAAAKTGITNPATPLSAGLAESQSKGRFAALTQKLAMPHQGQTTPNWYNPGNSAINDAASALLPTPQAAQMQWGMPHNNAIPAPRGALGTAVNNAMPNGFKNVINNAVPVTPATQPKNKFVALKQNLAAQAATAQMGNFQPTQSMSQAEPQGPNPQQVAHEQLRHRIAANRAHMQAVAAKRNAQAQVSITNRDSGPPADSWADHPGQAHVGTTPAPAPAPAPSMAASANIGNSGFDPIVRPMTNTNAALNSFTRQPIRFAQTAPAPVQQAVVPLQNQMPQPAQRMR